MVLVEKTLNETRFVLNQSHFPPFSMIVGGELSDHENRPRMRSWQEIKKKGQIEKKKRNESQSRWFKVPFSSPSWRSLNPLKGSLNHPKNVTTWITWISGFSTFQVFFVHLGQVAFFVIFRRFFVLFWVPQTCRFILWSSSAWGFSPTNGDGRISRCRISLLLLVIWISKSNPLETYADTRCVRFFL